MTGALPAFRADGPLPTGVTLLEASAGTGKTHTIASLVARYVAEGMPLQELLVVTFTRAATSELRERVRARLLEAEAALDQAAAGFAVGDDEVLALLATGTPEELAARRERIRRALAGGRRDPREEGAAGPALHARRGALPDRRYLGRLGARRRL